MTRKQQYMDRLHEQLAHLKGKFTDLEQKAASAETQSGLPSYGLLDELREKEQTVTGKLQELGQASEDAWDKLRVEADSAWNGLEETFETVRGKFEGAADRVSSHARRK